MRRSWFASTDISISILSKLSSKKLHCLKYVSKEWHKLISDRSFIHSLLKRDEPLAGFFFQEKFQWSDNDDMESICYIPVNTGNATIHRGVLDFLPEKVVILSSNNGLLCCRSCYPTSQPKIYICNPLNKQWTSIEWPNLYTSSSSVLAFDPFQNSTDAMMDFKLVAVNFTETEEDEYTFFFDIYSSETGLWRRSKESCTYNFDLVNYNGMFLKGIMYWLIDREGVFMFDLKNELSWLIMPPVPAEEINIIHEVCIGESKDQLTYVIITEDGLQLWALQDPFTSQWELRVLISLEELETENADILQNLLQKVMAANIHPPAYMDPLAFKDNILLLRVSAGVYLYDFGVRRMRKLCDVETLGPKSMYAPIVVPYAMSLVPLE